MGWGEGKALLEAARRGCADVVRYFISEAGARVGYTDHGDGMTALMWAVEGGHMTKEYTPPPSKAFLTCAFCNQHFSRHTRTARDGDYRVAVEAATRLCMPPFSCHAFMYAAANGHGEVVPCLVDEGSTIIPSSLIICCTKSG